MEEIKQCSHLWTELWTKLLMKLNYDSQTNQNVFFIIRLQHTDHGQIYRYSSEYHIGQFCNSKKVNPLIGGKRLPSADNTFSHSDRIPEQHRQTDRQTKGQTHLTTS